MQTFLNPKTPFLDSEGHLLANARVSILSVDTSGSLIDVTDFSGSPVSNPMITGSDGTFQNVPYIPDGVSYKVKVEKSTGIPPISVDGVIVNESELYEDSIEFEVSCMKDAEDGSVQMSFVAGIDGVRKASTSLGSVVCVGYGSVTDGAPSRIFTWIKSVSPLADNAVNVLRNATDSTGYWYMSEIGDVIDVRVGGLFPSLDGTSMSERFANLINAVSTKGKDKSTSFYFPSGRYTFKSGHNVDRIVLGSNAKLLSESGTVVFNIGSVESRGGKFVVGSTFSQPRLLPIVLGSEFRSSIIEGNLSCAAFSDDSELGNLLKMPSILIFDSFTDDESVLDFSSIIQKGEHIDGKTVICSEDYPSWLEAIRGDSVIINGNKGFSSDSLSTKYITIGSLAIQNLEDGSVGVYQDDTQIINIKGKNIEFLDDGKATFDGSVEVEKGMNVKAGTVLAPSVTTDRVTCSGAVTCSGLTAECCKVESAELDSVTALTSHSDVTDFSSPSYRIAVVSSAIAVVTQSGTSIAALFPNSVAGDIVRVVHKRPCTVMLDQIGEATYNTKGIGLYEYFCWTVDELVGPCFVPVNCNSDNIDLTSISPDPLGNNSPWVKGGWHE